MARKLTGWQLVDKLTSDRKAAMREAIRNGVPTEHAMSAPEVRKLSERIDAAYEKALASGK